MAAHPLGQQPMPQQLPSLSQHSPTLHFRLLKRLEEHPSRATILDKIVVETGELTGMKFGSCHSAGTARSYSAGSSACAKASCTSQEMRMVSMSISDREPPPHRADIREFLNVQPLWPKTRRASGSVWHEYKCAQIRRRERTGALTGPCTDVHQGLNLTVVAFNVTVGIRHC